MHHAPAKIILFGEHAVVYGEPSIAVPFNALRASAQAVAAPSGSGLTILARDLHAVLHVHMDDDSPDNALTYAAQLTLKTLNARPPDLSIELRSSIPIGGGFGSGAAVSAALIRELSAAMGAALDDETVNALVYEVEKLHHGTPSGVDNTVIVHNRPVYFVRGLAPQTFGIGAALTFVVADSGISASTRETVGDVRKLYEADPAHCGRIIRTIGSLVNTARQDIESGEIEHLGTLMDENHRWLGELTVSSEILDRLVAAARAAGALGAKLSGGGRGGSVIALVRPESAALVAAALRTAGAAKTWTMHLEPTAPNHLPR